jgi:hypothetical protein
MSFLVQWLDYGLEDRVFKVRFPAAFTQFSLAPERLWGPPKTCCNGQRGSFLEVKVTGVLKWLLTFIKPRGIPPNFHTLSCCKCGHIYLTWPSHLHHTTIVQRRYCSVFYKLMIKIIVFNTSIFYAATVFTFTMMMMNIIIIFNNCHRVVTRWQWLSYTYTIYKIATKFTSGGLHEKHVVSTWNVGNHLSICF